MKQAEIDFQNLSLKEYRDKFCKDLSLDVLQRAYSYSQNGHMPQNAISTAAVIYADPFKLKPLLFKGIMAEQQLNSVTVWSLQTETATAQRCLLSGEWDFHNRAMCVARLGENYACTNIQTLEFPDELIIGVYQHSHRFVAVVAIDNECVSAISVPKVRKVADIVAMNAMAHYPEYLRHQERLTYHRKHPKKGEVLAKLPEFPQFLLEQSLRFVEGINETSLFNRSPQNVSVASYLESCSQQLGQELSLASVEMFGEF